MTGASVVFADVDPDNGLMRAADLQEAVPRAEALGRPRAVFVVHLNGQAAPMAEIAPIARAAGMALVEDCCHAIGGRMADADGRATPVGSCALSDLATFSFHPVKTVTMGEGGAVTTNSAALAGRLRDLRGHGIVRDPARFQDADAAFEAAGRPNPWYYEMQALGHNYRACDLQCALGLSQLGKLARFVARRAELVAAYDAALGAGDRLVRPIARVGMPVPGWHLYPVLIDFARAGQDRASVMRALAADGIGTQLHYIPVPDQPYWRAAAPATDCPGARAYAKRALSLPLFPAMTESDVGRVVAALQGVLEGARPYVA
jgi:dTDP-4-amino-4,6-dideoxygalactose transaminase